MAVPEWAENLPESVQGWDEVSNSDSPDKFWDQITNMRSLVGQSIRIPGENAKAEDLKAFQEKLVKRVPGVTYIPDYENEEAVNTFYNSLGRPEKAEEYKMPELDLKGVEIKDEVYNDLKNIAYKNGLSQRQFNSFVKDTIEGQVSNVVKTHEKLAEDKTALKNTWGLAYEKNLEKITKVAENTGAPKPLIQALKNGHVDPNTAKWLLGIANSFKGEGSNLHITDSQSGLMTPDQARQEKNDIFSNKDHDYWHPARPGHEDAKRYVAKLYKMMNPKSDNSSGEISSVGVGGVTFST